MKGLLLASLHPEAWGEWCRIRQLTSTVRITFEAVDVALLEEESVRTLSRLKDPYGEVLPTAAHGTTTTETLPPTSFSDCGNTFCPGRPSHHRCGPCQKKFTSEKEKRRDPSKSAKTPSKGENTKIPSKGEEGRPPADHPRSPCTRLRCIAQTQTHQTTRPTNAHHGLLTPPL